MYINMLFIPIRELADKFNTLQMGMVSSERVFKVLDTIEVIPNEGTLIASSSGRSGSSEEGITAIATATAIELKGNIEFKGVWFAYNHEDWVLRDINFRVNAGQTLALVGATGAGKSSVINLVNRFYDINRGAILFDGVNISDYELHSLRNSIAVVLQDVFLFSDTIANNISLNDKNISREQIVEAAKAVGAHRFIERLPGGYDFNVMERGGMLSTGQRQLIAFIRAYVFNPKILILDEATSSIDTESEELIRNATQKLTENRTSIIIAHRLSTIQSADNILVFDKGEIKEQGTHQQLLSQNGIYRKLYEIQFKEVVGQ
jgi:ATP-binding cassette subfamily B protein